MSTGPNECGYCNTDHGSNEPCPELDKNEPEFAVPRLVALAEQLGLKDEDLDGLVHELCQEMTLDGLNATDDEDEQEGVIAASEEKAAAINNGGLAAQIEFVLTEETARGTEELLRGLAGKEEA